MQSDQEARPVAESYSGWRWRFSLGASRTLSNHVGLGGALTGGFRWASADASTSALAQSTAAPTYGEQLAVVAAILPIGVALEQRHVTLTLVPTAGVGIGRTRLYESTPRQMGPAAGASIELYAPSGHVGISAGAMFVPLDRPGRTGGHNDLGSYFVTLIVGADAK